MIKLIKNINLLAFLFIPSILFGSIITDSPDKLSIPSEKTFRLNREKIRSFKNKKITVAEYLTDPLIMYAGLWGCFTLTLPLWDLNEGLDPGDENYFESYSYRGFYYLNNNPYFHITHFEGDEPQGYYADDTFVERLIMSPFASGRIEPITKMWYGMTVFRGDIYAKNIIEPVFFTYIGLYMRAKNYHPAIMITEIILLALLYEFTIRPFYLNSSFEQFLKNPAVGITFGILLDELSTFLLTTPYKGLHVLAYILNPFNVLPNSRIHPMLFFQPYKKVIDIGTIITF